MAEGWISLHRKILDSDLWKCEPFSRGQAWVDLLLLANHEDSFFFKRGVKIDVKRGQLARSEVELADRWKWSRTKVRKFLNDIEKEQQIEQQKTNITQLVTIKNYDYYQKKEQQDGQQKDSRKTAEKQQKDTYNNDNNVNNENKIIYSAFYDSELEKSNNDELYLKFVKILFGENEFGRNLNGVLSITEQLTYDQFNKCLKKANEKNTRLSTIVCKIENDKKYFKGKTSLNLTLHNWLNNTNVKQNELF